MILDIGLPLAFSAVMGLLIWGYVTICRRNTAATIEAIRHASVPFPPWHTDRMGIQCSRHQRDLYEDVRDGEPMRRWLCPEPGCESVLADATIAAMKDQSWCSDNGMTAPGWQTLNVRTILVEPGRPAQRGATERAAATPAR